MRKSDPYPIPTSPAVSAVMRANLRVDTKPEVAIRKALHALGLRFRKDYPIVIQGIRIRPDIAFTRQRLAVFVDGCFWHQCPEHGHRPRSNMHYWLPKLERNVARDRRNNELLKTTGWTVLRFWEHVPASEAVLQVRAIL